MADDQSIESGVASVFRVIGSKDGAEPSKPPPAPAKRPKKRPVPGRETAPPNDQPQEPRPRPRIGRFPGGKNGPRKEKITGRVAPDLRDAYVQWALDDRCAVQELFERALIEFHQRYRGTAENEK